MARRLAHVRFRRSAGNGHRCWSSCAMKPRQWLSIAGARNRQVNKSVFFRARCSTPIEEPVGEGTDGPPPFAPSLDTALRRSERSSRCSVATRTVRCALRVPTRANFVSLKKIVFHFYHSRRTANFRDHYFSDKLYSLQSIVISEQIQ